MVVYKSDGGADISFGDKGGVGIKLYYNSCAYIFPQYKHANG